MRCRALAPSDFDAALALYRDLNDAIPVPDGAEGAQMFANILSHPGTLIIGAEDTGIIVSMATLHVMPNMTYGARPYALVENVVTLRRHRNRGYARAVIQNVVEIAWQENCYKIMLLTGQGSGARAFYEKLGFGCDDKHGMTLRRLPARKSDL